ncbi:diguanylate cyclase domain-containing protein [Nodosilinea nodulosa]|uniref:diguanylate cyclase domain-containing protein n=1 Tax=Nodosilinea nodulosa TaxID=416001 RepID=UPI000300A145|nr:diguanylate cyclase [Nodosilinea nodulosa]
MAALYPLPANEEERLAALYQYQILDTEPEVAFDGLVDLAAHLCQAPIAIITLVDMHRQWFKSSVGIDLSETPREVSFCTYAILHSNLLLVPDTRQDERFANNPFVVSEPHVCFYAGAPLITPDGYAIGTLCVIDTVPRFLSQQQQNALKALAHQVVDQLELHRHVVALKEALLEQHQTASTLRNTTQVLENAVEGISQIDVQGRYVAVNPAYAAMVGYGAEEMVGMHWRQTVHPEDIAAAESTYEQMLIHGRAEIELRGLCKDGSVFFKQVVLVKASGPQPDPLIFYCFTKDITLRKQAEAALLQAYDSLEQQIADRTAALSRTNHLLQQEVARRRQHEIALQRQAQRQRLMGEIAQRIRQSLNLDEILATTVNEVRQFLAADRVFIYRLETDWSGVVVYESALEEWGSILGMNLIEPCFAERYIEPYRQGRIHAMDNIETAQLSPCYDQFLRSLQVKANLIVPILQDQTLWGLLIAHQCREPCRWQPIEIDLMQQLSTQVAIAIQQASLYQQLTVANQALQRLAALDGLTQVGNRRCFDDHLEREWRRALREQTPLALILCDIDFFKLYNDTYGHQQGDACLRQVAQALSRAVERSADLVARYGGEEFAVLLPNTTPASAAYVADRLQAAIEALQISHESSPIAFHLTLSLGVASLIPQPADAPAMLIAAADQALYLAKAAGRDRKVVR